MLLYACYPQKFRHSTKHELDWTVGLDNWTGQLDWTAGLDSLTGLLDWDSFLFCYMYNGLIRESRSYIC